MRRDKRNCEVNCKCQPQTDGTGRGIRTLFKLVVAVGAGLVMLWGALYAQLPSTQSGPFEDVTYSAAIGNVQLYKGDNELLYPALPMDDAGSALTLSFDQLGNEQPDYYATVVHCNADWKPSELMPIEFLDGFQYQRINEIQPAAATRYTYTRYRIAIPYAGGRFKVSGNYVVKVFVDNDPDKVVLVRRFVVFERLMGFSIEVGNSQNAAERFKLQQVRFSLTPRLQVIDPYNDLKVCLLQNFRWDNAQKNMKPAYLYPGKFEYVFSAENDFQGGNEYRVLDARSVLAKGLGVENIRQGVGGWLLETVVDKQRTSNVYLTNPDYNGSFLISQGAFDRNAGSLMPDYVQVRFRLAVPEPYADSKVYVFGGFTGWRLLPTAQLHYNASTSRYECEMLLKQGIYNYHYVLQRPGAPAPDEQALEGSHFETENFYAILTYYRRPGDRFDRLVGLRYINYYEPE